MSASPDPLDDELGPELSPARQWAALGVLMLAVLVISIDNTVLGFAVPALSADLGPTSSELLWIVDSYAFVLAGLLVTMGNLGDRIGRRKLLLIGAAGFAAASVLAAYSTSPGMLIAARAILGVAASTLMPSTLSIIRATFRDPDRRRSAIALWTSGFAVGSALGPIVGGWLLEHAWWGSVFLLAVPVMALLLIVGPILLPESRNPDPGPFDPGSALLSLGAVLPIVYAIKKAAEHGPSFVLLGLAAIGVVLAVVFVRRQRRLEQPMLDVDLFANRQFSAAIAVNLLTNLALLGSIFLVAQHLQLGLDLGAESAGVHLLPGMIAAFIASMSSAALMRRVPIALAISAGLVSIAIGFLVLTRVTGDGGGATVVLAMTFIGLGAGGASSIGANLVMAIVPARRAGSASAVSETAFEFGAAVGIAVLGSITAAVYRRRADDPAAGHTLADAVKHADDLPPAAAERLLGTARDAFASGMRGASVVAAVLMLVGAVAAARTLRSVPVASLDAVEH